MRACVRYRYKVQQERDQHTKGASSIDALPDGLFVSFSLFLEQMKTILDSKRFLSPSSHVSVMYTVSLASALRSHSTVNVNRFSAVASHWQRY